MRGTERADVRSTARASAYRSERGSAVADFAFVASLLTLLVAALLQLVLALHVRNVLTDAAGEGARRAALAGGSVAEAQSRVREVVGAAISPTYAQDVTVVRVDTPRGRLVEVTIRAPLPVIALLGPSGGLSVQGHAIDEEWLDDLAAAQ